MNVLKKTRPEIFEQDGSVTINRLPGIDF